MALKVWLPLNGNLNNKGIGTVNISNNGAIVSTEGKIGSCYLFDGNDDFISLTGDCLYSTFTGGA